MLLTNLSLSTTDVLAVGAEGSDQVGGGEEAVLEDRMYLYFQPQYLYFQLQYLYFQPQYLYYMQIKFSSI